ncbi:methyl-accepting chemotaxis protein [Roseateles sp.]|uniref:methyl-accepting chemotaxis protein n=1 Tax=Roseateles sp. TaxID=1971397 RepID=UPI002DF95878|nr:methyl-accepting chemotaxis protein [Roseateles sp.]HEV6965825.1 methyl-accepting chemotaxis protein [Roseateles sp.]
MFNGLLGSRSIAQRLTFVLGLVLLISFIGSAIGFFALNQMAARSSEMYGDFLAAERDATEYYRLVSGGEARAQAIALSGDLTLGDQLAATAAASTEVASGVLKKIEPRMDTEAEKALLKVLDQARGGYRTGREALMKAKKSGDEAAAKQVYANEFQPAVTRLSEATLAIVKSQREQLDNSARELESANARARTSLVVFALISLALGVYLSLALGASITRPLRSAAEVAEAIAEFDLTRDIPTGGQDEVGRLLNALHGMQSSLQKLIGEVRGAADSIGTASAEIATGNIDLSQRTEQTASNLQNAASSMSELTGTVKQTADAAMTANQLASSAASVAQRGGEAVSQVVATMDEISQSSRKINEIIGVIDGIAFQTNILALNAAVEAARAGEQGRGFAVVAGEVRALAQRSAEAAKEIKSLISASVERVDSGTEQVQAAGATMTEIVASVQRVTDIIGEISAAAREQSEGIGVVNGSVVQLDQMTQQNAALVEESAAAAESLREQSARMAEAIGVFKLSGSTSRHSAAPMAARPPLAKAAPAMPPVAKAPAPKAPVTKAAAPKPPMAKPVAAKPAAQPAKPRPAPEVAPRPAPAPRVAAAPVDDGDWETF